MGLHKKRTKIKVIPLICILAAASIFLFGGIAFGCALFGGIFDNTDTFGIGADRADTTTSIGEIDTDTLNNTKKSQLSKDNTNRDISPVIQTVSEKKQQKANTAAAALKVDEVNHINNAKANRARQAETVGLPQDLPEINWDQGKDAFMAEWTTKINAYLGNTPLGGYGADFAAQAWECGIDPRWSPTISNTESTKGQFCFRPHNAWGWGQSDWNSWPEAISAHIHGLSSSYGYTISLPYAQKYCPPTYESWYNNTLREMKKMS